MKYEAVTDYKNEEVHSHSENSSMYRNNSQGNIMMTNTNKQPDTVISR